MWQWPDGGRDSDKCSASLKPGAGTVEGKQRGVRDSLKPFSDTTTVAAAVARPEPGEGEGEGVAGAGGAGRVESGHGLWRDVSVGWKIKVSPSEFLAAKAFRLAVTSRPAPVFRGGEGGGEKLKGAVSPQVGSQEEAPGAVVQQVLEGEQPGGGQLQGGSWKKAANSKVSLPVFTCVFPDGRFYKGGLRHGLFSGYGTLFSTAPPNICRWEGYWVDGVLDSSKAAGSRMGSDGTSNAAAAATPDYHGTAVFAATGEAYVGGWRDGLRHGPGSYSFSNGTSVCGM